MSTCDKRCTLSRDLTRPDVDPPLGTWPSIQLIQMNESRQIVFALNFYCYDRLCPFYRVVSMATADGPLSPHRATSMAHVFRPAALHSRVFNCSLSHFLSCAKFVVIFVFMVPLSLFTICQGCFRCQIVNFIEMCLGVDLFINLAIITCFPSIRVPIFTRWPKLSTERPKSRRT